MSKIIVLLILLMFGWSDVFACGTDIGEPIIVNCFGCP